MIAFFFIMWFVFHDPLAKLLLRIGLWLMYPLKLTLGWYEPGLFSGMEGEIQRSMTGGTLKLVDISVLVGLSSWMGTYYRWPLLVLMGWFAWKTWRHPIIHLHTAHTFESLIRYQSLTWKEIVPVANLDLCEDTSPAWRPARRCVDLAKENGLIHARLLKLEEAWIFLGKQLGERFTMAGMKPHEQALFAVFAARIARDKKESAALLNNLNESCRKTGLPDCAVAKDMFEKYRVDKRVLAKIKGFGYTRTVLFQMLVEARRYDGKLPTSNFIWLKPVDRTLWYALDRAPVDVERFQVAVFAEGMAVASQWQAEALAIKHGLRMGVTQIDSETRASYRVNLPYLITAMTAFAIDLEDNGEIDYPPPIAARTQNNTNERVRFDIIRDNYIMAGLSGYFTKAAESAKAAAARKKVPTEGDPRVAV